MKRILLLLPFLLLLSCAVQKRKYQKGFYFSRAQAPKGTVIAKKEVTRQAADIHEQKTVPASEVETEIETASAGQAAGLTERKKQLIAFEGDCDDIIFRNGDEVRGKVMEITDQEIKYKKCDFPDGPLYSVKKSAIFMIRYANGTKETFKTEPLIKSGRTDNSSSANGSPAARKEIHPYAIMALVAGILGIFLLLPAIAAIILGDAGMRRIKAQPDKYEGHEMAFIGKILGLIVVIGFAAILLFILILALAFV
jgi:hypothetical protein